MQTQPTCCHCAEGFALLIVLHYTCTKAAWFLGSFSRRFEIGVVEKLKLTCMYVAEVHMTSCTDTGLFSYHL